MDFFFFHINIYIYIYNTNCNRVLLTDPTKLLALITLASTGNNETNTVANYTGYG